MEDLEEANESEPNIDAAYSASEETDLGFFLGEKEPTVEESEDSGEEILELKSVDESSNDDGS